MNASKADKLPLLHTLLVTLLMQIYRLMHTQLSAPLVSVAVCLFLLVTRGAFVELTKAHDMV
jgi:hypothetical protein